MANAKFVIYQDKGEKYRWRLVAPNGQEDRGLGSALCLKVRRQRAAEEVTEHAGSAEIVEE